MLKSKLVSERMGQEGHESARIHTGWSVCVHVCVCEHKPIPAPSHVLLNASIPRSHSIQQLGYRLGYQPVHYSNTSLDSAESSTLAPSFASQKWSAGRLSLSSLKSDLHLLLLFFHLSLFLLYVTLLLWEAFFVTDKMLTIITEGNWRGRGKAEGGSQYIRSKLRGACTHICIDYVLTYVRVGMLWPNRADMDHALHRAHCQCFSFLRLLPLSNILIVFRQVLRSEAIHAGMQLCLWQNMIWGKNGIWGSQECNNI